jgi:hypothetical protein
MAIQPIIQATSCVQGQSVTMTTPTNIALSSSTAFNYTATNKAQVNRQAVVIAAYGSTVYVQMVNYGTTPSTATSSSKALYTIPAGTTLTIGASRGLDFYVTSAGNVEVLEIV